jgi:hypothetical protein
MKSMLMGLVLMFAITGTTLAYASPEIPPTPTNVVATQDLNNNTLNVSWNHPNQNVLFFLVTMEFWQDGELHNLNLATKNKSISTSTSSFRVNDLVNIIVVAAGTNQYASIPSDLIQIRICGTLPGTQGALC